MSNIQHESQENIMPLINEIADYLSNAFNQIYEACKRIFASVLNAIKVLAKGMTNNPRYYHLSMYSKKSRVRKKYRNKTLRMFRKFIKRDGQGKIKRKKAV